MTQVRDHVPTIWASFTSAVRTMLQLRCEAEAALGEGRRGGGGGGAASSWSSSPAWLLLRELYADSKLEDGFSWKVGEPQRAKAAAARKAQPLGHEGLARRCRDAASAAASAVAKATLSAAAEDRPPRPEWASDEGSLVLLPKPVWEGAEAAGADETATSTARDMPHFATVERSSRAVRPFSVTLVVKRRYSYC